MKRLFTLLTILSFAITLKAQFCSTCGPTVNTSTKAIHTCLTVNSCIDFSAASNFNIGTGFSDAVMTNRTITINGTAQNLSTDRTWTLTTSDIAEGTNLYYTLSRFNSALAGKTTDDVAEGSNLYYTAARFNTAFSGKSTTDLTEGTNLYYTAARFNTAFSGKSTTDLSEGTNLYHTTARARGVVSAGTGIGYNSGTGVITNSSPDQTVTITSGTNISVTGTYPSFTVTNTATNPGTNDANAYSAGTVYSLTASMAKVDFGTTDPAITIPATGKYLITTNVKLAYNGVISATNRTVTLKLRRTNNTAADLSNSTTTFVTQVVSLVGLTGTAGDCDVPALIYNGTSGDTIEMQGQISSVSGLTGSMDVQEASIVATRIN